MRIGISTFSLVSFLSLCVNIASASAIKDGNTGKERNVKYMKLCPEIVHSVSVNDLTVMVIASNDKATKSVSKLARKRATKSVLSPNTILKRLHGKKDDVLKSIWKELGLQQDSDFKDIEGFEVYEVTKYDVELDGRPGKDAILRITSGERPLSHMYMVFCLRHGEWYLIGYITIFDKYETPEPKVISIGKKTTFISIPEMGGSGSGAYSSNYHWYSVSNDELIEVLTYPAKGHVFGWGGSYDRQYSTELMAANAAGGIVRVEIRVIAKYFVGDCPGFTKAGEEEEIFSATRNIRFVQKKSGGQFEVDANASDAPRKYLNSLFRGGDKDFINYYFFELQEIAKRKDERKKDWLRCFLRSDDVKDSENAKKLFDILRNN